MLLPLHLKCAFSKQAAAWEWSIPLLWRSLLLKHQPPPVSFRDSLYRLRAAAERAMVPGLPARSHQHCCSAGKSWEPANNSSPAAKVISKWGWGCLASEVTFWQMRGKYTSQRSDHHHLPWQHQHWSSKSPPTGPCCSAATSSLPFCRRSCTAGASVLKQPTFRSWLKDPLSGICLVPLPISCSWVVCQSHLSPKRICEGLCEVCATLNRSYQGLVWDSNNSLNKGWTTFINWWCNLIKCTAIASLDLTYFAKAII